MFFLILILVFSVFYWIWSSTYWSRRGIKGPVGMPISGNMFKYMIGRTHYGFVYEDVYKSFPNAAYIGMYRFLNEPAILLHDLEMIKEVLIRNFNNFRNNVAYVDKDRDPIVVYDPFMAKDERWKAMRSEFVPMLTPNKVKLAFRHIPLVCKKLDSYLAENFEEEALDAKDICSRYTLDVVASAACSLDGLSFTNSHSDFTKLVENIFMPNPYGIMGIIAFLFLPKLGHLIRYRFIPTGVQRWLTTVIGRAFSQRRNQSEVNTGNNDVLQWLIEAKQKAGEPVDESFIIGHCSTFLLEGYEMPAALMSFALYEIAKNPHVQTEIRNEIDRVLDKFSGEISLEAVLEMTYLEATLFETLRLYPLILAFSRQCTAPFELPPQFEGTSLKEKVVVKEGTVFVVPVKALHYDPELYPDPYKFDPERFSEENKRQRPSCAFLGFGEGPRMCPGRRFGLAQSKAAIATILVKYELQLSPKTKALKFDPTTFLTVNQDPIWIKFKPRKI